MAQHKAIPAPRGAEPEAEYLLSAALPCWRLDPGGQLIGLFYKIPLLNIIGEQGTADFGNAYNIYAVLLTISTADCRWRYPSW